MHVCTFIKKGTAQAGFFLLSFSVAFAQRSNSDRDGVELAHDFVDRINDAILFPLIALLIGVALLVFIYGAFEFVLRADNDSEREKGKQHMLWGTIGLLVMVSAMALLQIAANTFDLRNELEDAKPNHL